MRALDLAGTRFGRLTALTRAAPTRMPCGSLRTNWFCRCDCGKTVVISPDHLRSGHTASCGCLNREVIIHRSTTHGEGGRRGRTAEYQCWANVVKRCENRNSQDWRLYGGRGIRVCPRWRRSFAAFLADMGRKPSPRHSIDRIDVNGHYEPSNCRWATASEQRNNHRPASSKKTDEGVAQC